MYDADVNTFTPEGRILQLEYAIEASKQGATSIGICTAQGECHSVMIQGK